MTDRELLELAAKAADIPYSEYNGLIWTPGYDHPNGKVWDPLSNDGDALRLAVKLGIDIMFAEEHDLNCVVTALNWFIADSPRTEFVEALWEDPPSATRRAIVACAAELGKTQS
jgi:hypothetical protein